MIYIASCGQHGLDQTSRLYQILGNVCLLFLTIALPIERKYSCRTPVAQLAYTCPNAGCLRN